MFCALCDYKNIFFSFSFIQVGLDPEKMLSLEEWRDRFRQKEPEIESPRVRKLYVERFMCFLLQNTTVIGGTTANPFVSLMRNVSTFFFSFKSSGDCFYIFVYFFIQTCRCVSLDIKLDLKGLKPTVFFFSVLNVLKTNAE